MFLNISWSNLQLLEVFWNSLIINGMVGGITDIEEEIKISADTNKTYVSDLHSFLPICFRKAFVRSRNIKGPPVTFEQKVSNIYCALLWSSR